MAAVHVRGALRRHPSEHRLRQPHHERNLRATPRRVVFRGKDLSTSSAGAMSSPYRHQRGHSTRGSPKPRSVRAPNEWRHLNATVRWTLVAMTPHAWGLISTACPASPIYAFLVTSQARTCAKRREVRDRVKQPALGRTSTPAVFSQVPTRSSAPPLQEGVGRRSRRIPSPGIEPGCCCFLLTNRLQALPRCP
jgi:hypothetical protein